MLSFHLAMADLCNRDKARYHYLDRHQRTESILWNSADEEDDEQLVQLISLLWLSPLI